MGEFGVLQGHRAENDAAGGAVDGYEVSLLYHGVAHGEGLRVVIHDHGFAAAHAGLAHAARDHGRVAGHAAAACQDALRLHDAVNVVGRGFHAHENDLGAHAAEMFGFVGVEHHGAEGRAR